MLIDKIQQDLFTAMKASDKMRIQTLRFLLAAIKRYQTDTYPPASTAKLTDEDTIKIIRKQIKEHQESITAFTQGKRQDLVDKETQELKIIEEYAPKQMGEMQVEEIVKQVMESGIKDFGHAMKAVMGKLKGQADGSLVAKIVKEKLNTSV